jgi:hypothetical protein
MRFFGTALLMAMLAAAGLAAFSDGEVLNPTSAAKPGGDYDQTLRAWDGGMGVPPTPGP